jgi:hypothetical protein
LARQIDALAGQGAGRSPRRCAILAHTAAIQLALESALAQNPSAVPRPVSDFYDDSVLREQEDNGFVASLYH